MDTSSAAAECVTLMAAAGYAVHTFPTGQGNVIGNPILPVIKLTANPRTQRTMSEHIDVDVTGILQKRMNMDGAGEATIIYRILGPYSRDAGDLGRKILGIIAGAKQSSRVYVPTSLWEQMVREADTKPGAWS